MRLPHFFGGGSSRSEYIAPTCDTELSGPSTASNVSRSQDIHQQLQLHQMQMQLQMQQMQLHEQSHDQGPNSDLPPRPHA